MNALFSKLRIYLLLGGSMLLSSSLSAQESNCSLNVLIVPDQATLCGDLDAAELTVEVDQGATPFKYEWSNGETSERINSLVRGTYNVLVKDALGCEGLASIALPFPPLEVFAETQNASGKGQEDGKVSLSVIGGTPPYNYEWNSQVSEAIQENLSEGTYAVTIEDNNGCSVSREIKVFSERETCGEANLALEKPVNSSISIAGASAEHAVDGNKVSRWANKPNSGAAWLSVDLLASFDVCKVGIHWEAAFARNYRVEGSLDGTSWFLIEEVLENVALDNEIITFDTTRFIRIFIPEQEANPGISMWELEVFGTQFGTINRPPVFTTNASAPIPFFENPGTNAAVLPIRAIDYENDGITYALVSGNELEAFSIDPKTGLLKVNNKSAFDFELKKEFTLQISATDDGPGNLSSILDLQINLVDRPENPCPPVSIAVGSDATASSSMNGNLPERALDNSPNSFWQSDGALDQQFNFSLFQLFDICELHIDWGDLGLPTSFVIETSTNALDWDTLAVENGNISPELSLQNLGITAQHVRISMLERTDRRNSYTIRDIDLRGVGAALNHPPTLISEVFEVEEEIETPSILGVLEVRDIEEDEVRFEILSGNIDATFEVDPLTGIISVAEGARIDFETYESYALVLRITDQGYGNLGTIATVKIQVLDRPEGECGTSNLAQKKIISASSSKSKVFREVFAIDGNPRSAWLSSSNRDQWLYLDMGTLVDICSTRVVWGSSYARAFDIQVSDDTRVWETVFTNEENDQRISEIGDLQAKARYIRIAMRQPVFAFGFMISEWQVFGRETPVYQPPRLDGAIVSINENLINGTPVANLFAIDPDGDALTYTIQSGNTGNAFGIVAETGELFVNNTNALDFESNPTFSLFVQAQDDSPEQLTASANIRILLNDLDETACTADNLALLGTVSSSSSSGLFTLPQYVNDQNLYSRWESNGEEEAWIEIDLEDTLDLCEVRIIWHEKFAQNYMLLGSLDRENWQTIQRVFDNASLENILMGLQGKVRYIRVEMESGTGDGFSIWEIEIQGRSSLEPQISLYDMTPTIFPNPASDLVFFRYITNQKERSTISIYSLTGQKLWEEKRESELGENLIEINVSNLPLGNYFIRYQDASRTESFRLMKVEN